MNNIQDEGGQQFVHLQLHEYTCLGFFYFDLIF